MSRYELSKALTLTKLANLKAAVSGNKKTYPEYLETQIQGTVTMLQQENLTDKKLQELSAEMFEMRLKFSGYPKMEKLTRQASSLIGNMIADRQNDEADTLKTHRDNIEPITKIDIDKNQKNRGVKAGKNAEV